MKRGLIAMMLLGGCATAGVERERGLDELRRGLVMDLPVGRVVDGWLVHGESGLALLRVPDVGWRSGVPDGKPLLFEGAPGVALFVDSDGARLVRMNGATPEWTRVMELPAPKRRTPLLALEYHTEGEAPPPGVTRVPLDGLRFEGRELVASMSALSLAIGYADDPDDVLLNIDNASYGAECGGEFRASLERTTAADGVTWFRFVGDAIYRVPHDTCTDAMRDARGEDLVEGSDRHVSAVEIWFVLPPGGGEPRIVASQRSDTAEYTMPQHSAYSELPIRGGHLQLRSETGDDPFGSQEWTWTVVNAAGDTFQLATSY